MPPVYPPTPTPGLGYGGADYEFSPYGSGAFPRQPIPPTGGYGGQQYGYNSYGSLDTTPPRATSAVSLDGYRVELFFSEEMRDNAAFIDPLNYTFAATLGVPLTTVLVTPGVPGTHGGYTSVIITHSGSTLGGSYTVTVVNIEDLAGNVIGPPGANTAAFLSLGETATYTVTATAGDILLFQFSQDMLSEAEFTPGIVDPSSYGITTTYPLDIVVGTITNPVGGDASQAEMEVTSMTSAVYDVAVTPSDAIVYDGSILPSASTTFTGVEVGIGTSSASSATKLLLAKTFPDLYGWAWEDTTGKVLPSSTYRMDFTFDPSVAAFTPPLYDAVLGTLTFSDGAVQVDILIRRVAGIDVLDIVSGAFSAQVPASWSTGSTLISVVRNQKGALYSILVNDVPLLSAAVASFTGAPTINPGARFLLSAVYTVSTFKVEALIATSSQTVFSSTWNFLHGSPFSFTGSAALAGPFLQTDKGPLVKGWGDATPATTEDVEVRLNGTPVDVGAVNPYTGAIYPAIPIPFAPPGTNTIEVDYQWFPSPALPLVGLNTDGLILNKWNLPKGHHTPVVDPTPPSSTGAMDTARFPMGIVLPPLERPEPVLIGHRFIGYEQDYTASLNSPTTLLLNQNNHRVSTPPFEEACQSEFATFDGNSTPPLAEDTWSLDGTDAGSVVGDGTYRLIDDSTGTFTFGEATVYYREVGLSCPSVANLIARFQIEDYEPDGVYTGVGFGVHDNHYLYLVGALIVNDVRHIGLLTDADKPQDVESWILGPSAEITITSSTTFTMDSNDLPAFIEPGDRFQILDGSQAGVYTITECGLDDYQGSVVITIDPANPFPEDPSEWGNETATVIFEVPWDEALTTYRLIADLENLTAQVFVGGTLAGTGITLTTPTAIPADTSLLIPTGDEGRSMFGSFSRIATNTTLWSFNRYTVVPDSEMVFSRGIVVAAEMSQPPESDVNHEWFFTNKFGFTEIDSSGDTLLLKSTSESEVYDLSLGYARIEPFLTSKAFLDVDAHFRVESGVLGAGDGIIRARDDIREAKLVTVLYTESSLQTPYRQLHFFPVESLSGLFTPENQGWSESTGSTLGADAFSVHGQTLTMTKADGDEGIWYTDLVLPFGTIGSRIFDARLAITSYTAGTGDFIGPIFGCEAFGASQRIVAVTFKDSPARVVLTSSGSEIAAFPFDWTDGEYHDYRVIIDVEFTLTVTLVVDDVVQGTAPFTSFDTSTSDTMVFIGASGSDAVCVVEWDSFYAQVNGTSTTYKRTLGVWLGGDLDDIDSYAIPRTDSTSAPNSSALATIEEMDWTALMRVRVHLDPTWGVAIYRPDLPLPPWFTGNFATQLTDPTAAWINVEYRRLPTHDDVFGSVAFGALDPRSATQQRWLEVRYHLYNQPDEDYIAHEHMVLNYYNVVTSGEFLYDVTPEVVTITSLTSTLVSIRSAHMNADRVFHVVVDGTVRTDWTFDKDSQALTFTTPLPASEYPVTVTFAPGEPITSTYLCTQPLEQSVTLLNEGTPPMAASQQSSTTREVVFGSKLNDPSDTLSSDPDFILNDPYRSVEFSDDPDALYEGLEFCTVEDGEEGLLSIACDGPAPGAGLVALELEGDAYHDQFSVPGGPGGPWGNASPVIKGTASTFPQTSILHASGGSYVDGVLGPGTAVMFPNWPGEDGPQRGQDRGLQQEVMIRLRTTIPYEDTFTIPSTADNTPPTYADPDEDPNPDGTPGVQLHGACAAQMVTYSGASGEDRLGPWGGLPSLGSSVLGGGAPLDGDELTLNGGAPVPGPVTTDFQIEAAN